MNKHTPTLWAVNPEHSDEIIDSKGELLCSLYGGSDPEQDDIDAAFIVKAVNCHDDLVGALDEALEYFTGPVSVAGRLHAALAKAKEE